MRFFKHGEVLAISLPESIRKKMGIAENDEFEFSENADGTLKLVRKSPFAQAAPKSAKSASATANPSVRTESQTAQKPAPSAAMAPQNAAMPWTQKPAANQKMPQAMASGPSPKPVATAPSASASSTKPNLNSANLFASTGTELDRYGYLVLDNEMDAKGFSHRFESQIKGGDIKGVRGFDKKFYLASRAYIETFADKLLVALKEPKTVADLAALTKQPQEGVLCILYLLKEEGEIIEKKKGLFVRVI
ncbi:hypothetical protein HY994_04160 [Candidatus Micrarchaeota archaeon]|nr:hypothetical protein [Candidatus Micrarchaeota archaeon]